MITMDKQRENEGRCRAGNGNGYETVGEGNWLVRILKRRCLEGKWKYDLEIGRVENENDDRPPCYFDPADVLDLPKVTQVLAATLVTDGCLEPALKDDLDCLATALDWFLGLRVPRNGSTWVVVKREPLEALVEFLWETEFDDYQETPVKWREHHIFRALAEINGAIHGGAKQAEEYLAGDSAATAQKVAD